MLKKRIRENDIFHETASNIQYSDFSQPYCYVTEYNHN